MLCDNLEEWDGVEGMAVVVRVGGRFKREGTHVYLWLIHVDVSQKTTQHYKAIILQIKIKKKKILFLMLHPSNCSPYEEDITKVISP